MTRFPVCKDPMFLFIIGLYTPMVVGAVCSTLITFLPSDIRYDPQSEHFRHNGFRISVQHETSAANIDAMVELGAVFPPICVLFQQLNEYGPGADYIHLAIEK